jgi:hypothetical protein
MALGMGACDDHARQRSGSGIRIPLRTRAAGRIPLLHKPKARAGCVAGNKSYRRGAPHSSFRPFLAKFKFKFKLKFKMAVANPPPLCPSLARAIGRADLGATVTTVKLGFFSIINFNFDTRYH